ncbi:unnamed protein product [Caenorhabditis bovis]|uniref:Reduced folate carrier n=1 Tax=Caenorhabditis bovis TaxID=2654633 RepID=A0A8S1EFX5_9PELO|nr:unnamed protein product [Caenorhabditis bovis]
MQNYIRTVILLCSYGVLKEFRPTEPYMYEYEHVNLNISEHTLNHQVYPIWTYSYLAALIPAFLLTDVLLYKSLIVFEAFSYTLVWILFVFGRSVLCMQLLELFYGWATATEIAYFAYIYVKVPKENFKSATAFTRAALLLGRFAAYALAQLLIGLKWGDYMTLHIISLVSMCLAIINSLILPNVSWRSAFARKLDEQGLTNIPELMKIARYKDFVKMYFSNIHRDLYLIYTDQFILKWSAWWALANCIFLQVTNYTQTLWGTLSEEDNRFNGITEALVPLFGIPADLLTQRINLNWTRYGELVLAVGSIVQAAFLLWMSQTHSIYIMYFCYILYRIIYQATMTIAQCNLATRLQCESYGLLFGINTFIALSFQTVLTVLIINVANLSIRPQFLVYSFYHIAVAVIFFLTFSIIVIRKIRNYYCQRI